MKDQTNSDLMATMPLIVLDVAPTPPPVVNSPWAQALEAWVAIPTKVTKRTTKTTSERHSLLRIRLTKMKRVGLYMI